MLHKKYISQQRKRNRKLISRHLYSDLTSVLHMGTTISIFLPLKIMNDPDLICSLTQEHPHEPLILILFRHIKARNFFMHFMMSKVQISHMKQWLTILNKPIQIRWGSGLDSGSNHSDIVVLFNCLILWSIANFQIDMNKEKKKCEIPGINACV